MKVVGFLIGAGAVLIGIAQIYPPAAWIVGGTALCFAVVRAALTEETESK